MAKVTALLLNWKRPENIVKTIESIKKQNVDIDIWLWNNNPDDKTQYDVKYQFNSPENFICWPRWLVGSLVSSEYIFTLDDDVELVNNNVIEQCISYFENKSEKLILGFTGVKFGEVISYNGNGGKHIDAGNEDVEVDIVKGRFMFMKASLLNNVLLERDNSCEDIKISSYSDLKIIPSFMKDNYRNLRTGSEAICVHPEHNKRREAAVTRYFINK